MSSQIVLHLHNLRPVNNGEEHQRRNARIKIQSIHQDASLRAHTQPSGALEILWASALTLLLGVSEEACHLG